MNSDVNRRVFPNYRKWVPPTDKDMEEAMIRISNYMERFMLRIDENRKSFVDDLKVRLAKTLMEKSYKEGHFILASGRESDYYFDCRVTSLSGEGAWLIGKLFNEYLLNEEDINGVGGMTLGADPLMTATALFSITYHRPEHLNALIVRKEVKDHGRGRAVEGLDNFPAGGKIWVLEDVITTGGSALKAARRLEAEDIKVKGILAILDREEGGRANIEEAGYRFESLFTIPTLKEYASKEVRI